MKHRTSEWSAWGHRRAQHNWNIPFHLPGTVFKIILIPSTLFSHCCSLFVAFKSIFPLSLSFHKCLSAAGQGKSNFGQLRRSAVVKRVIEAGSKKRWKEHPVLLCGSPVRSQWVSQWEELVLQELCPLGSFTSRAEEEAQKVPPPAPPSIAMSSHSMTLINTFIFLLFWLNLMAATSHITQMHWVRHKNFWWTLKHLAQI